MTTQDFKERILPLKNPLYRFAFSYLKDEAEAQDVVQEVMIECWEKIDDANSIHNMEAYCVTLTKHRSLDKLKRKGRQQSPLTEIQSVMADPVDPDRAAQGKEAIGHVQEIMDGLPEKQREVLHLRDMEGYSYKEICEMLSLEMNHVKVLLHRARKFVQSQWQEMNAYGIR